MNVLAALLVASSLVTIHVDTTPSHRIQEFKPIRAIGTAIDVSEKSHIPLLLSPSRVDLMKSTGLGTVTYRNNTELSIQDWHWNPNGSFSDAAHQQGYWTSSPVAGPTPIMDSFGYPLPHRGSSRDQSNDNDYSRIDDGDPNTYWKSNPYLTHAYTGDPDSAHPQWAAVQFLRPRKIDAIKINWVNPYATEYVVQYWTGNPDAILHPDEGSWHTFAHGTVQHGSGGTALIKLADAPVTTTFIRVLMSASSNTCDTHGSGDPRNCVGYAIDDIGVGTIDANGAFHNLVHESKYGSCLGLLVCKPDPKRQTLIWTSSDDPWHSAADKVKGEPDQIGFDRLVRSGITRGLPTIYPVAVFYSTPQNAANEVRYLEARHYPIWYIEMGEEVDGQYALPEDYAALYIQFAKAIHAVAPDVKLGGPVFEGQTEDTPAWADSHGDKSWLHRFVLYLKSHGHLSDLSFMSYEHYPYNSCDTGAQLQADLLDEPSFVRRIAHAWRNDGITVPLLETEDNFSANGTAAPQHVYGALWEGDFFGASLESNISYVTYFIATVLPLQHITECGDLWGNDDAYIVDQNFNVRAKAANYYALQLITQNWMVPGDEPHGVYPVTTSLGNKNALVTAYALKRPDGTWSVLVDNKDKTARAVTLDFSGAHFHGNVRTVTFGRNQYHWSGRPNDLPNPDLGLKRAMVPAGSTYTVAPESLTVFVGKISS